MKKNEKKKKKNEKIKKWKRKEEKKKKIKKKSDHTEKGSLHSTPWNKLLMVTPELRIWGDVSIIPAFVLIHVLYARAGDNCLVCSDHVV